METLERVDDWLLGQAQKLCDRVQILSGRTKFFLEKWALLLAITSYLVLAGLIFLEKGDALMTIPIILSQFPLVFLVRNSGEEERLFLERGILGPPHSNLATRIASLFMLEIAICLVIWLWVLPGFPLLAGVAFTVVYQYISGCIPKPPGKSKIREWYERGIVWLEGLLQPSPQPTALVPVRTR